MRTQFIDRPGGRIACEESGGTGQQIVLLPGMGWPEYGARHTGDDILALVRQLDRPSVILGHSAGAASAIWGRMAAVRRYPKTKPKYNARASAITMPVLVVMGGKDPDFPDAAAEANLAHSVFPNTSSTVTIVEGSGHYPHADAPRETLAAITAFLATADRHG
jgi:pimeloyl-ACP methyl ester carboxylesterase